jgi:hypothetical protein
VLKGAMGEGELLVVTKELHTMMVLVGGPI